MRSDNGVFCYEDINGDDCRVDKGNRQVAQAQHVRDWCSTQRRSRVEWGTKVPKSAQYSGQGKACDKPLRRPGRSRDFADHGGAFEDPQARAAVSSARARQTRVAAAIS